MHKPQALVVQPVGAATEPAAPPGAGLVRIERLAQQSVVTRAFATSPLRLLNPRNHGRAAWVYTATYGGGLVDGDAIDVTVDVGAGAAAVLSTQASTKVYRSPTGTSVRLHATVGDGALLILAPDPVVCFAGASYRQEQHVNLASTANVVIVDWLTSGRRAMGERWAFDNYVSRLTIRRDGRLLVYDALSLRASDGDLQARMQRFEIVCLVAIMGADLREHAVQVLGRIGNTGIERRAEILTGASRLGDDGGIVRMAGVSVESIARAVREHLGFVPAILGDDPWTRKW